MTQPTEMDSLGNEHPQLGLTRNSWLSGTASWAYQTSTQYILGLKSTYEGLQVNPCIPRKWDSFKVTREFRNAVYHIQVKNPNHVCKGAKLLEVHGQEIEGNIVPAFGDGKAHMVEVTLSL